MSTFNAERIPKDVFEWWAKSRPFPLDQFSKDKIRAEFAGAFSEAIPELGRDGFFDFTDKHGAHWVGLSSHGEYELSRTIGDKTEASAFDMGYKGDYFVYRTERLVKKVTKIEGRREVGVMPITLERHSGSTAAGKIMDHIKRFGQAFRERDASRPVTLTRFEQPTGWVRW